MSDHDQLGRTARARSSVLTPEACAISGFTLAVLTMTGQGVWTALVQALFGGGVATGRLGSLLASVFMATLLLDAFALWLARRAVIGAGAPWAGHLARATVVVAAVAAGLAALALVVTLLTGP